MRNKSQFSSVKLNFLFSIGTEKYSNYTFNFLAKGTNFLMPFTRFFPWKLVTFITMQIELFAKRNKGRWYSAEMPLLFSFTTSVERNIDFWPNSLGCLPEAVFKDGSLAYHYQLEWPKWSKSTLKIKWRSWRSRAGYAHLQWMKSFWYSWPGV